MSTLEEACSMPTSILKLRRNLYVVTFLVHAINGYFVIGWIFDLVDKESEISHYYRFWPRLLSLWTIAAHAINVILGFTCDQYALINADNKDLVRLRKFKNIFFSTIVWTISWVSSTLFWFFYHYDKKLIKMCLLEKILSPINNHIVHTFVVLVALCEAFLQTSIDPTTYKRSIFYTLSVFVLYMTVLAYTYATSGTWIYPFLDASYRTVYFPLIVSSSSVLIVVFYYAQWPITRIGHLSRKVEKIK